MNLKEKYDVVVIGAGVGGLTAGAMLGKAGFDTSSVFVAVCLTSAFGSLLMGLWANLPIAVGCALGYLDFRFPDIAWRTDYPNLDKLHAKLMQRQSFIDSLPK